MKKFHSTFASSNELEQFQERVGKLRLLMAMGDDFEIQEIEVVSIKMRKIRSLYNYEDVPLYTFKFNVTLVDSEIIELELDAFYTENFKWEINTNIHEPGTVSYKYDYKEGFEIILEGHEESDFISELSEALLELGFFEILESWNLNKQYIEDIEVYWKDSYIPMMPGVKEMKYINENNVRIILENDFSFIADLVSIKEKIKTYGTMA